MNDYKYIVRIYCRTYNHEKYITDALNGFAEQQTNFPFVATIVEDCSTDNTANVIRQYVNDNFNLDDTTVPYKKETDYANITYAQHKTNKNCYFAVLLLKYNHYSLRKTPLPYIAEWTDNSKYYVTNEGDDFFIDPLKLQKQVDFMEAHPNCSVCTHAAQLLFSDNTTEIIHTYDDTLVECPAKDVITGIRGFLITNSMLFRYKTPPEPCPDWMKDCPVSDIAWKLYLLSMGNYGYINEVMSCYRMFAAGSWTARQSKDFKKRAKHFFAMRKFWKRYDSITNKKYHKIIKNKIKKNSISFIAEIVLIIFRGSWRKAI